eukprot:GEZU01040107.1.p1 GENE.GEZU01040107.1~~GEZU01040107.1.p1  ORF type:complete len:183 (+),score=46.54 GEZU01040107.1:84-632(+)
MADIEAQNTDQHYAGGSVGLSKTQQRAQRFKAFMLSLTKRQFINVSFAIIHLACWILLFIASFITIFYWFIFVITFLTVAGYITLNIIVEQIATRQARSKATSGGSVNGSTNQGVVSSSNNVGFTIDHDDLGGAGDFHASTSHTTTSPGGRQYGSNNVNSERAKLNAPIKQSVGNNNEDFAI